MRDLTATTPPCSPTGIAFDIADLVLAKSWAGFHDFRMTIRLDHGSDDEAYEEVLEFRQGWNAALSIILWRNESAVFMQPLLGRRHTFSSVTTALNSLHVVPNIVPLDTPTLGSPAP